MPYHVRWALLGQSERRLDSGSLTAFTRSVAKAAAEVSAFLRSYIDAWRSDDGTHWRARRPPDADLEVRIWVEDLAREEVCAA